MSLFATLMGGLLAVLVISLVLTMARLLIGPSIPDRAVAFDMVMIHVVGIGAITAALTDESILIDAVIVVAVLGFLGTVALARYIEEGGS
ncbi:cation transporter [Oscillochloris sp. ZM17-4]|uniref:monovalent cation/H+ antiporter complex subunit F n=1 Tax=Oscillochloris sp. ZM17-4 TaxID=2866714 RepID=UPI001C736DBE|nr:monovalent cation/H+ antiporter complex subunit F [Oscillochloris sp. ZM17-4]MBX0327475.1 cation transporter [Oscillochloris sp. ZM17-4]